MQDQYTSESCIDKPIGNNRINFEERKKQGSDCILRIPPLIQGTLDDVRLLLPLYDLGVPPLGGGGEGKKPDTAYEYISDSGKLISASGLQNLVQLNAPLSRGGGKAGGVCYIIDNHNHAFYCRYKSYLDGHLPRGSHLIHIDQHSDLSSSPSFPLHPSLRSSREGGPKNTFHGIVSVGEEPLSERRGVGVRLNNIARYTNEVLDIASFIKPAKECGLISDYEMVLTEFSLLNYDITTISPSYPHYTTIVDIDLDFRAPEMSIEHYDQTIQQVKKIIALPEVKCITIASSPTYISQERALEILRDIID